MFKRVLSSLLICIFIVSMASCGTQVKNPLNLDLASSVEIDNSLSYFSDAVLSEEGKTVDYICIVTLNSKDEANHKVKIVANCESDYNVGHILEKTVYGTFEGNQTIEIPEAGLSLIKVIFTFNVPDGADTTSLKLDRNLPDLYVVNA